MGGVVVAMFAGCINLKRSFVGGRFSSGGYYPIKPAKQKDNKHLTLGKVHKPSHPIMKDVECFDGGESSFFCPGELDPVASVIAEWSNGFPLVAELQPKGRVIALNFFPPSSDTGDERFWVSSTDGARLLVNALTYCRS
jgi:hypothetical protein